MPQINSKSEVRRPILETRQYNRKEIQKKLKVMMTDKVIMIAKKEDKKFHSLIQIGKNHRGGGARDFFRSFFLEPISDLRA